MIDKRVYKDVIKINFLPLCGLLNNLSNLERATKKNKL